LITIQIKNWEKHNPRRDLKSMPWFRIESHLATDPKIFELSVNGKWLWVFLLSLAAREMSSELEFGLNYLSVMSGIRPDDLKEELKNLSDCELIAHQMRSDCDRMTIKADRMTIVDDLCPPVGGPLTLSDCTPSQSDKGESFQDDPGPVRDAIVSRSDQIENVPKRREEKRRIEKRREEERESSTVFYERSFQFDLAGLFELFPRRQKRGEALTRLAGLVSDYETFEAIRQAILNYRAHVEREQTPFRYQLSFPTFLSEWRDWLDPDNGTSTAESGGDFKLSEEVIFRTLSDCREESEFYEASEQILSEAESGAERKFYESLIGKWQKTSGRGAQAAKGGN
jgi:hypothetical protein